MPFLLRSCLLALIAANLVACAAPNPRPTDLGGEQYLIRLAPSGAAGNQLQHPAVLDPTQLSQILGSLRFEEQGLLSRSEPQPVFDQAEIDRLAPGLSQALANAAANQRIDFVSHGRTATSFGNAMKTEGALFVAADGTLNIAFSGIRQIMTVDDDFTRFREVSLGDPFSMERSMVTLASDQPGISAKRHRDGSTYPMWVSIALQAERSAASQVAADPAARDQSHSGVQAPAYPAPRPVDIEVETSATAASTSPESVRNRLEFLKELHEDGLISDQEYQRERERALQRLD